MVRRSFAVEVKGTSKNAFFPRPLAGEGRVRGRFFGFLARLKMKKFLEVKF